MCVIVVSTGPCKAFCDHEENNSALEYSTKMRELNNKATAKQNTTQEPYIEG